MPQRVTNTSVVIYREGKRLFLDPGTPYDFTEKEVEDFKRLMPGSLRKPVVEVAGKPLEEGEEETLDPKDKPLTAAQKKAQKKAEDEKRLKDEQTGGTSDDDL